MKISLITATFNSEASIASALKSISSQIYVDLELVVVDGGSTDKTVSIVKENYSRPVKIKSEKDRGVYDAINKGIKESTGDIIGLVHSDDFLASPDIISEIAEVFQKKNVDGVYGDLQYVRKDDTSKVVRYWKSQEFAPSLLNEGWMPAHPTLFLKKEVYQKHGNFNLEYKIAADYDFMLRIFSDPSLNFHYLPRVITKMRTGGLSNRSFTNILMKSAEDYKTLKANRIPAPLKTLVFKNLRKLGQFTRK